MTAVRESVEGALDAGIEILTLFAFSTENWQRPRSEVLALMGLLRRYVAKETRKLKEQGCEVHVLGDLDALDESTRESVDFITSETVGGMAMRLNLMISYSGRAEILQACRRMMERAASGELAPEEFNEEAFESVLFTEGLPDPDLLIRTSDEFRLSNFMLWQVAYT